ncbi:MAG TPA: ABC transporter ATP-binding protein [Myxococcota bacterium]|jgi:putative ABC transport system ATP-binding protein
MGIIELRNIEKSYRLGDNIVHALRGASLSVETGEMVAIMGASGSGKSTMLNVIGTLDRPDAGQYILDGEAIESYDEVALSELRNKKIGFVFQSFHLLPRDSALENVELPMIYAGERSSVRKKRAHAALARVGLGDRTDHLPTQLSGGQQQRVSIARALVNEPVMLLADEPTGALDSATTGQVMELFCELHEQGMTVVLVTHDPNIARYASRVVTFKDGNVVTDEKNPPRAPRSKSALASGESGESGGVS